MRFGVFKYIFFGLALLFLFHFESLSIGSIKISHLWKGLLLIFLINSFLKRKTTLFFIFIPMFGLAFLQLFNFELVVNPINAVIMFGTTLILPLIGIYVLKLSSIEIKRSLLFFASFYILVFIPYELGFLESYGEGYVLSKWGGEIDLDSLIGPFQTVHSASTALAGAFLVIIYFWFIKAFNRYYLLSLLILGFYFLIQTYARTGMVMVILGIIPMIIYFIKKEKRTRLQLFVMFAFLAFMISTLVLSNDVLLGRITGDRSDGYGGDDSESFENLGSGRGGIYINALEIYSEADFFEQVFGMGQTEVLNRLKKKMGSAFLPHNGFLVLLLSNGVLGLFLFLLFLIKIYKFQRSKPPPLKIFIRVMFVAYLTMTFFQNFDLIYMYFFLVLCLSYVGNILNENNFSDNSILKSRSKTSFL